MLAGLFKRFPKLAARISAAAASENDSINDKSELRKKEANPTCGSTKADWPSVILWAAVIGLIGAIPFCQSIFFQFVRFDDDINIYGNPHLSLRGWEQIRWSFTDTVAMRRYVPIAWITWSSIWQCSGGEPWLFHVANLISHIFATSLLFLAIVRVLRIRYAFTIEQKKISFIAGVCALLWALHPMRVETVAWSSGLLYNQSFALLLCSFHLYLNAQSDRPLRSRWRYYVNLLLSSLAYLAALLVYPVGAGFFAVFFACDALLLKRFQDGRRTVMWTLIEKLPYIAISASILLVTILARENASDITWIRFAQNSKIDLTVQIGRACYLLIYYLWRQIAFGNLCPLYVDLDEFSWMEVLSSVMGFIAISFLLIIRYSRTLFLLWISYIVILFPVLGFNQTVTYPSDRYAHIPSAFLTALLAVLLVRCLRFSWPVQRAIAISCLAILSFLSYCSMRQTDRWSDSKTLFTYIAEQLAGHPSSADTYVRLALVEIDNRNFSSANAYLNSSLQVRKDYVFAMLVRARMFEEMGLSYHALRVYFFLFQKGMRTEEIHQAIEICLIRLNYSPEKRSEILQAMHRDPSEGNLHSLLKQIDVAE